MGNEGGGVEVRGIGARLRAARERKGLTLLQAAEKLHVDVRVLEALEAEDFSALGADVYVRGHLRRYAELTGESASELPQLYANAGRSVRPDLTRIPRSERPRRSARLMLPALLLVVGFALAGALWWLLTLPGQRAKVVPAVLPVPVTVPGGATRDSGPGAAANQQGTEGGVGVSTPASGESAAPAGAASPPLSSGATASGAGPQLQLHFSAASWVEISDADGRRLLHGMIEAGSDRVVSGAPPLRVVLGNAAAVAMQLEGRPLTFAPLMHHDGSARLAIDAAGHVSAAAPRLAHEE